MTILAENSAEHVNILNEIGRGGRALIEVVAIWKTRRAERRDLARALPAMPYEALKDLGLTLAEARRIVRRPFWQK